MIAAGRCRAAGLLGEAKHVVVSSPESVELESQQKEQREAREKAEKDGERSDIASRTGIDPLTGLPKVYTQYQIDHVLSADDYKRAKIGGGVVSTFTDHFNNLSKQREGQ